MKISFRRNFNKQLKSSNDKKLALAVLKAIETVKKAKSPEQIPHLRKLKGHNNAYRLRIGSYRLGLFIEGALVDFAAIADRKDFYKGFP
jgi:mRNA interferase RelE/StbE